MKYSIVLTLFFLHLSTPSHAWVIDANFDSGTAGSIANGPSGITEAFALTKYSNEIVRSGSLSAKATIRAKSAGFGDFGGNWLLSSDQKLGEGDEIWYRTWLYVPHDFSFDCGGCTEGPKFMRIHTKSATGENEGYWNLHLLTNGITLASSVTDDFYTNHPYPRDDIRGINGSVNKGEWHAYEQYVKFSSTSGKGIYRAWYDGKLIFEDTVTKTLKSSTSVVDKIQLFTYWRGVADEQPDQDQSVYVDEVMITNEQPDNKDAKGNSFLGVGNATFTAAPKPPQLLSLE
ncbi:polysaccharide lyase [bacterium]|nr:polysaccharide lyase [bacterium]